MTTIDPIPPALFRPAVEAAVCAPSMHNCQPWRFRYSAGALEIRTDSTRSLPAADPTGWAARIACGAAAENARLALAYHGVRTFVAMAPDQADPTLVARLRASGQEPPSDRVRSFYGAIRLRHSNRRPFLDHPVEMGARHRMRDAAQRQGSWLHIVSERERIAKVAEIMRLANGVPDGRDGYGPEIESWQADKRQEPAGVARGAAGPAPEGQDLLPLRNFGGDRRRPGRDFEPWPILAILGSRHGSDLDDVRAGMALQDVLLSLTVDRLSAGMLSQAIEIPEYRSQLSRVAGASGPAQMVLRVGHGQPTAASPRRSIDDVIESDVLRARSVPS